MVVEGDVTARYAVALQQVSLALFSVMAKASMIIAVTLKADYHYVCEYCYIKFGYEWVCSVSFVNMLIVDQALFE